MIVKENLQTRTSLILNGGPINVPLGSFLFSGGFYETSLDLR